MKEETQVVYISDDGHFRSTRKVDVETYENAVNNYVKEKQLLKRNGILQEHFGLLSTLNGSVIQNHLILT